LYIFILTCCAHRTLTDVRVKALGPLRYQLTGFVCHLGESVTSGHYAAYTRHKEKPDLWNMCDDVRVPTVCPDYLVYRSVARPTIEPALKDYSLLCLHIWARRSRRRKRLLSRTTYIWCFTSAYLPLHHISHLRSHTRKLL
jgi:hypothetical protein